MAIFSSFHRQSSLEPQPNHRQSSLEPQEDHKQSSLEPQKDHRQSSLEPHKDRRQSSLELHKSDKVIPAANPEKSEENKEKDSRLFRYEAMGKAEVKRRADESFGGIEGALNYCLKVYPEHQGTAPIHNNLAVLYELKRDQRSADRYYQTALDIMEKCSIMFARIYLNYTEFLIDEGRASTAEEVIRIWRQKSKSNFLKSEFDKAQALLDSDSGYRKET